MKRSRIISTIGEKYLTSNIENEEFSYKKALSKIGKNVEDYQENSSGRVYQFIDLRFSNDKISILVETKDDFSKWNNEELIKQIQTYINCEKELSNNKIIVILANTNDDRIKVWYGDDLRISFENNIDDERKIKSFDEYENIYFGTKNDKLKVIQNTYNLNELLHKYGIKEKIRSQFVGTCLLALKNGLVYNNLTTSQVIAGVREKLEKLLNDNINKAEKLVLLDKNVLSSQDVRELTNEQMNIIIKALIGILFGVALGLAAVPLAKRLILSRSEDPGDIIVLRKKSTYILTALAGAVASVGLVLTADDEIALIRNLVLLLPMLTIAIVDSLIRKIPNSLLLSMIVVQASYVIYQCVTTHTNYTLLNAGIGFFLGFVAFTIPTLLKVPVGAGDVKYSAVVGLIMYMGCYLQTMATVGILVLLVFVFLKITKRGGMKTLIPMGPFISVSVVISMCFPVLNSLVVLENIF